MGGAMKREQQVWLGANLHFIKVLLMRKNQHLEKVGRLAKLPTLCRWILLATSYILVHLVAIYTLGLRIN